MSAGWQPIGKLGTPRTRIGHNQVVVAKIWQPDGADSEDECAPEIAWAHVAYPTDGGWQVGSGGFRGVHGFASFGLHDATHFMPLPTPPVEG